MTREEYKKIRDDLATAFGAGGYPAELVEPILEKLDSCYEGQLEEWAGLIRSRSRGELKF